MLVFHKFISNHLEEAVRVYVACFNAPPWNDDWSIEAALTRLRTLLSFPNAIGVVATRNEKIVGLAIGHCEPWTDGLHYYLNELCIDPEEQRQGYGRALLSKVLLELERNDVSNVYLLTERSTGADAFFRKQGFLAEPSSVKLWREV